MAFIRLRKIHHKAVTLQVAAPTLTAIPGCGITVEPEGDGAVAHDAGELVAVILRAISKEDSLNN
jgi:hypothetical protein